MRIQDELRTLYPSQGWQNQKFIISELEQLALSFDSEELLGFLEGQLTHRVPYVRDQALFGMTLFFPPYYRRLFGIQDAEGGVWTDYAFKQVGYADVKRQQEERQAASEGIRRQAMAFLEPVVKALIAGVEQSPPAERLAPALALSQFRSRLAQKALVSQVERAPLDFGLLLATARSGAFRESEATFIKGCFKVAAKHPDPLLVLASLEGSSLEALLIEHGKRFKSLTLWNLAVALGHAGPTGDMDALMPFLSDADPWTRVYGMRLLEGSEDPRAVEVLESTLEEDASPFVRTRALRAAGSFRSRKASDLCLRGVRDDSPNVQAQALESLVRQHTRREDLVKIAQELRKSPHLRVQVNALLALADPSATTLPDELRALLGRSSALHRLEGTYALGFYRQRLSRDLLAFLALRDPVPAVRSQAVKSLSRFAAKDAGSQLLDLVLKGPGDTARVTAGALTRYSGDEAATLARTLGERLREAVSPACRAAALTAIGSLASRAGSTVVGLDTFLEALEDREATVRAGAIKGLRNQIHLVDRKVAPDLRRVAQTEDPGPAARLLSLASMLGDAKAVEDLAGRVASSNREIRGRAAEATLELGLVASEILPFAGFELWRRTLDAGAPGEKKDGEDRITQGWRLADPADVKRAEWQASKALDIYARSGDDLPAPLPEPTPAGPKSEAEMAELSRKIENAWKKPPSARGLGDRLQQNTYLVDADAQTKVGRLVEWLQFHPAVTSGKALLAVPVLALMAIGAVFAIGLPDPAPRELPPSVPSVLTVAGTEGKVTLGTSTDPASISAPLRKDESLSTDAGARALLLSGRGGRVELKESTRFTARDVSADGRDVTGTLETGLVEIDFRQGSRLILQQGSASILVENAAARCEIKDGGVEVTPKGPGASWTKAGETKAIEPGKTSFLEVH